MDESWTHETQDVFEALEKREASPLISFLLSNKDIHPDLKLHVEHLLNTGSFAWKAHAPKLGRPFGAWGIWSCIGLYQHKKQMQREAPKKLVVDIEQALSDTYGLNVEDIKKYIRNGKQATEKINKKSNGAFFNQDLD